MTCSPHLGNGLHVPTTQDYTSCVSSLFYPYPVHNLSLCLVFVVLVALGVAAVVDGGA